MTDLEIINVLQAKALAVMREPPATVTGDPSGRADRLEVSCKYLICCAILTGEIPFEQLKKIETL